MSALFAFACGSKLDTKYTDDGIAAADTLCACLDTADVDAFASCSRSAEAKLSAAEKAMIDRGYFNDHNDAAPMKAFKARAEFCRSGAVEAGRTIARRAAEPKPIDAATIAKAVREVEAVDAVAKPSAAKPATKTKPTARRASPKPTTPSASSGSSKSGAAPNEHAPLWAK